MSREKSPLPGNPDLSPLEVSPEVRILGVTGSPRRGGNSEKLAERCLRSAEQSGLPVSRVRLPEYQFQPCIGCECCRKDKRCTGLFDGMQLLYPLVERSLGLLCVCPVHNYNITAWMKAFLDRLYCFYDFGKVRPGKWSSRLSGQGRKAALISVGEQHGTEGIGLTLEAMRLPLEALGYHIIDELPVTGVFPRGRVEKSQNTMARAEELGRRLAESLQKA